MDLRADPHLASRNAAAKSKARHDEETLGVDTPSFVALYRSYFPYIWRSVQRLGVPASHADDAVQEVFIIAHAKLATFEGRSSLKTWLYGIAVHRARVHRGRARLGRAEDALDAESIHAPDAARPDHRAVCAEAARAVNAILDRLDGDQREVFVLAELEELSAPEIVEVLDVKLSTVYSRLRLARAAFAKAAARYRAQDDWRAR
jgi:RNA polymerase sigma-70 factor (ECF subfamily)